MSILLQSFPFQTVALILPERKQTVIRSKVHQVEIRYMTRLQQLEANLGMATQQKMALKHWEMVGIVCAVLLGLGGVFLTLAMYRVLPHSVNVISKALEHDLWGKAIGISMIPMGAVLLVALIYTSTSKSVAECTQRVLDTHAEQEATIAAVQRNAEVSERDAYLPHVLKDNELFVVKDDANTMTVYHCSLNERYGGGYAVINHNEQPVQQAFDQWCHQQNVQNPMTCIDLDALRNRIEEHEREIVKCCVQSR